jgi:methionine-rich copper-binding protein CopC
MTSFRAIAGAALVLLSFVAAPRAFGHAERAATTPEVGARVDEVPGTVSVSYTEPPAGNPVFHVLDGCGDDVVQDLKVQDMTIDATLAGGQPGAWKVEWRVISGVDGHDSRDSYSFRVAGQKDCSVAAPSPSDRADDSDDGGSGASVLLPVAIGGAVLIGLALLLRGRSS